MRRRTILAALGGTAATALAGCVGDGTPSNGDGTPTDTADRGSDGETTDAPEDGTDTPTATPGDGARTPTDAAETPVDERTESTAGEPTRTDGGDEPTDHDVEPSVTGSDVETAGAECSSGEERDHADASFESAAVTIEGVTTAPNPCHEATIESATVEGGELRVRVGLESTKEACVECVGEVAYSAKIDVEGAGGLDAVTVEHGESGETYTTRRDESTSPTPTPPGTTEYPGNDEAVQEPDPDLPIYVTNRHDESHEVTVTVARESGETVYDETVTAEPGDDREIYNLQEAEPDGIETFEVRTAMDGRTESVRVETNACYGSVYVEITEEGDLFPYYSIC